MADSLRRKEQELEWMLALDQVRDSFDDDEDPATMFTALTRLLHQRFQAQGCAILLLTETRDTIEHVSSAGIPEPEAIQLCYQAMEVTDWSPLPDTTFAHTLGAPVKLKSLLLGGIVIVRQEPFTEDERALLRLAESQIDSAVIQARTIWKVMQRNRELEAIYEIDHLRDYTTSENDLISGFTSVLLKHFSADLCMIILTHVESGELIVRGVVDKHDLSSDALEQLVQAAKRLEQAQVLPIQHGLANLRFLGAPLAVSGTRLGAVVVGRKNDFRPAEIRLLSAMCSQMDSALAHSRVSQQLAQRTKELEVIYRIDQIRDQEKDFDTMLQKVLHELCRVISGEMGYIMLYDENQEEHLQLKASTIDESLSSAPAYDILRRYSREALESGQLVHANPDDSRIRSIIAVPLILNDEIIGVFGAVNHSTRGFTSEDRRLLTAITSQVDTAIFEQLEQRRMRNLLSRSVDPRVLEHLLAQADSARLLTGERVVLSVLFADLRGSTEWAEQVEPEELVSALNLFLSKMTEVIFKHGGTLDKFVGDQVLGLFGTPLALPDHAHRAARAALEMQAVHAELQRELRAADRHLPAMGVAICSGEVIAGEFGPPIRTDFTAIGKVMNLCARLCNAAAPGQILISQPTRDLLTSHSDVRPHETLALKGIKNPPQVFELLAMKE